MDFQVAGWISAVALSLCGIPQAWKSLRNGHSRGIDVTFLTLWGMGEVLGLYYAMSLSSLSLITNYTFNIVAIFVIAYFKIRPRA